MNFLMGFQVKDHDSILIQWPEEDRCHVASLPEFGPYARTHGAIYAEALRNARGFFDLLTEETSPLPKFYAYCQLLDRA